jgi:hypothetical protein
MQHVSKYHSGSVKVRAVWRFNLSNFHTAFRNKNRRRNPVASVPTSSTPHMMQVLRSFLLFLNNRRRVPTLAASTMVKACSAFSHLSLSSLIRPWSSRWRSHMGAASSASAWAILSRRLLISSSGMCSRKSATTSLPTISVTSTGFKLSAPICKGQVRFSPIAASREHGHSQIFWRIVTDDRKEPLTTTVPPLRPRSGCASPLRNRVWPFAGARGVVSVRHFAEVFYRRPLVDLIKLAFDRDKAM